ncbi:hypothetical protein LOAG_02519 [Loa loa]|uniref:Uncharacterized protein n=1 Tax=Loa loa TaxID=7209 RepID=A0A1S0U7B1_LOALO|nr:hypothetical protein LOAG_02519 [Loa loa]EFO25962.1 hypothetical protein LOAG_02519 [Loa loa]
MHFNSLRIQQLLDVKKSRIDDEELSSAKAKQQAETPPDVPHHFQQEKKTKRTNDNIRSAAVRPRPVSSEERPGFHMVTNSFRHAEECADLDMFCEDEEITS